MMKIVYHEGQGWIENYVKYKHDENYNYFVWIGSRTMGVYRFVRLHKGIKRSVHYTDIKAEDISNDPFDTEKTGLKI